MKRLLALLVIATGLGIVALRPAAGDSNPDPHAAARREFIAALEQAQRGVPLPPAGDSEALRSYPLYPYLQAARLQRRFGDPAAAPEIQEFLEAHAGAPVSASLRRSWLMELALRRQWEAYLTTYREVLDDTIAARCNAFEARIALGRTEGLADEVAAQWLHPTSLPPACDPAFDWLRSQGKLTPALVEQRARLALDAGESGLARFLARSLPPAAAAPITQWASLIERPRASVDTLIAEPSRSVEPAALQDGWSRFARIDAEAAAARLPALLESRRLDERAAGPFALAVALPFALSRDGRALEYFARAHPDDFDERQHEWHVRAAIWAGDWKRVRAAIEAMPEPLRNQNRWRYWSARAAEQLGEQEVARAGYAAVVPTDNWYAVLAAARLGRAFTPTQQPIAENAGEVEALASDPAFVRTRELLLSGMPDEAGAEWRAALEALPLERRPPAVRLASQWGWYLPAIAAAAKLGLFNDYELLYPRPYDTQVQRAVTLTGLPADLIYAIIRQESLYRADAGSSAGALGLMQLLPSTAKTTARKWGMPAPSRSSLLEPSVNVPLGSAFLRDLLDRADGQAHVAIAGYNAGPGAARRWLPPSSMEADRWVENIPYNETRAYVQRVLWHKLVFAWLADGKPRDASEWLATIRPLTAAEAADAT